MYVLLFNNDKEYVGVSKSPLHRLYQHRSPSEDNDYLIAKAVRKYGKNSFVMSLLAGYSSYQKAYIRERKEIDIRNTITKGYNLSGGGGEGKFFQDSLIGQTFDYVTVITDSGNRDFSQCVIWECNCICGKILYRSTGSLHNNGLNRKHKLSCGCKNTRERRRRALVHGMARTPTYSSWAVAKKRCTNKNAYDYYDYGGRGIRMCESWQRSFMQFHHDMHTRPENLVLCRKDKNKDYCKDNCFWGTRKDVSISGNRVKLLTAYGETKSMAEWSRDKRVMRRNISYTAIRARKNILGYSDEDALKKEIQ